MLNHIKTIGLIGVLLCLTINPSNGDCPTKGKVGGKAVPDVLSLVKGQNGFSATVEIITPEEESIMVTEKYNGAKKFGSVEINKLDQYQTETHHYYAATNEKYVIEDYGCTASELSTDEKYNTINAWVVPESAKDEIDLFGNLDYLGPTQLMIWAQSVSDKAQYVATQRIDGRNTDHWFHCLSDSLQIDWWFDSSSKLPFRFALNSTGEGTDAHVYNFLIFEPLQTSANDLVSYPIGFGCYRSATNQPKFPSYLSAEKFSLDMEAMIMYTDPDKVILSSNRMLKYQNTYSFEITDEPNTTRIIQNPKHMGRYVVDAETGECKSEVVDWSQIKDDNLAVKWPWHKDVGFDLMKVINTQSGIWSNYMGQVSTDSGTMDVWEDDLTSFFSEDGVADVSVTYYFPSIDRSKNPNQAPAKIVLKPHNKNYISMTQEIPYQVEIIFIDYEEDKVELSDRFDVTGCYDGPGEFTWFQIVMSDPNAGTFSKDLSTIREYFEQTLSTFVPVIRTPEIIVNLYEFNYYVTVKLLERPPFKFYYSDTGKFEIENPTSILIRDHLEDCGDICTNDKNCHDFAYCSDFSCQIFSSSTGSSYASLKENTDCTVYFKNGYDIGETVVQRNILASTRNILSQIKTKVNAGEFVISKYALSADDLFIVSGPEEIGGIEDEFNDKISPIKGDEFAVIQGDSRLTSGETIHGVAYQDCLKLCINDDDCYSLSYCFNHHDECMLSTETKANLTAALSAKTTHADGCDVMEKSFMAFYRKFPGQSLVRDAIDTITDIDESECARRCYEATGFPCKSFDYCTQPAEKGLSTSKHACFLHQFHLIEDTKHEIKDKIWDFSTSSCDHYAVVLSRDYTHYVGRQFKAGSVKIIKEITDVPLERCASDCNSADEGCLTFEYCESLANERGSKVKSTCRLSTSSGSAVSYNVLESTSQTCSVYTNKAKAIQRASARSEDHFGVAMGLGSFFFVAAFAAGIAGSIYYQRRRG